MQYTAWVTNRDLHNGAFVFSPEHNDFQNAVAALARAQFADSYLERATRDEMCWPELKELGRQGLLGLSLDPSLGGQGADAVSVGIACEQLAWADFNLSYLVFASELSVSIARGMAPEVVGPVLRELTAGDQVIALALTEPRGGSDVSRIAVRAVQVEGGWRVSGEKTSVTLGSHAAYAILVASEDPSLGSKGTRRFLVRLDDPGVDRQLIRDLGFRPLGRASLTFDDVFVPSSNEIRSGGTSGVGAQLADFNLTRTLIGLMVVGAARRAVDLTVDWVRQREAFGRKISSYQGVSFTLAEIDTKLEAARWLCYRSLGLRDAGLPHMREAAMCKWWAPRVAVEAINDCIVLHGHVGWSADMPFQQLLLDVSGLQIGDGTPQIQKLVIARDLIGREYVG